MKRLFVDVDDTLVLYNKVGPNPLGLYMGTPYSFNTRLVDGIREFHRENPASLIVIWSGGGKDYASMWAFSLGLSAFITPMTKDIESIKVMVREGDVVIDDEPVPGRTHSPTEWPEEE